MQYQIPPSIPLPPGLIAQMILSTVERERAIHARPVSLHPWPHQITLSRDEYAEVAQ